MSTFSKLLSVLGLTLALALPVALLILAPWTVLVTCVGMLVVWMTAAQRGRQSASLARMGLATILQRLGSVAVVVIGIAGVVGVLVALLAMGTGFEKTLRSTGTDDTLLVFSTGARTETSSSLSREAVALVDQIPQIKAGSDGRPLASAEQLLLSQLPKKGSERETSVAMRGVGERAWQLRPKVRMTAGRKFTPGLREIVVGRDAQSKFEGLGLGEIVNFGGQPWTVVGTFDSGDVHNSELWSDAGVMASAYRLGSSVNAVMLRLEEASVVHALRAHLQTDPRLNVEVQTTREYYARQSAHFTRLIRIVGLTIGALMALGAVFGALNATFTAIATRGREIGTLRALGFHGAPVVLSVLIEIMLLAALGGALGTAAAWVIFDGFTASTTGAGGQVVFAFDVSPALLWDGLKWALAIGFVGGAIPALRAARIPITAGLREL